MGYAITSPVCRKWSAILAYCSIATRWGSVAMVAIACALGSSKMYISRCPLYGSLTYTRALSLVFLDPRRCASFQRLSCTLSASGARCTCLSTFALPFTVGVLYAPSFPNQKWLYSPASPRDFQWSNSAAKLSASSPKLSSRARRAAVSLVANLTPAQTLM